MGPLRAFGTPVAPVASGRVSGKDGSDVTEGGARLGTWAALAGLLALAFAMPASAQRQERRTEPAAIDGRVPDRSPEPEPTEAEPQEREPRPEPELMPLRTLAESAGWTFPEEPEPSDPEQRIEARENQWLRDQLGQDQREATGADRWYHEMGRQMRSKLQIDARESIRERRRGMTALQRLVDELGRYAHGPEGVTDRNRAMPPVESEVSPMGGLEGAEANERRYLVQRRLTNAPVRWDRVDVRLVHAPDGDLLASWITRSSGNAYLDQAVLQAVHEGAADLRPPPQPVVGRRLNIVSEWRFEIGDVATFLTESGCVMNPEGGVDCAALGRGLVRTRVTLLRVVDDQHPDPRETSGLRPQEAEARERGPRLNRRAPRPSPRPPAPRADRPSPRE
jgi:outer membrane biosynthesis protein TonB